ncbi:hypothetical protein CONLIGDRAFT_633453 [Coniochaeta ligniaria NRRL 30616]|uniref:Zn(2)-C6 fungal-type domain-containing protein n=1 Tax=Coniochaeta ligniaria NRRL 30616 TaxID=1408157 RepID=A0A1J7JJ50_9PEZI|nr:hypothetical protein CONLIGDRAFT_633453 [Coniochaeta ligniaria NRRL 30616]
MKDTTPARKRMRKRKACLQCTKSKRKCDKTSPVCKRCLERGDSCRYELLPHLPPSVADVLDEDHGGEASGSGSPDRWFHNTDHTATYTDNCLSPPPSQQQDASPQIQSGSSNNVSASAATDSACNPCTNDRWFLDPESWDTQQISRPELALEALVSEETLPHYISRLQAWLRRWVEDGHSPLMHRQLYRGHMPDCVQDAFTALTAYYATKPTTKPATMRMVNNRAKKLVDSHSQLYLATDTSDFAISAPSIALDTLTHVSRTQALFVYQMIRLFDGDIRSRAQAEEQSHVLTAWACQMLASARLDCSGAALLSDDDAGCPNVPSGGSSLNRTNQLPVNGVVTTLSHVVSSDPPSLWRTWVLAESVRRTYLMANFMQSVYHNIKHGWSVCPGGAAFSARAGLWDATTASEWCKETRRKLSTPGAKLSVSKSLLLLESMDTWGILQDNKPEDVDDFTIAVLEIAYGMDLVEHWVLERGGGRADVN